MGVQGRLPVEDRYVPALPEQVQSMLVLTGKIGDVHIDLGCGDGAVIGAGLAMGLDSQGVELDAELVAVAERAYPGRVRHGDWFDVDLSHFDLVTVYCSKASGDRLLEKARREMRRGARFVTFWGYPSFVVI